MKPAARCRRPARRTNPRGTRDFEGCLVGLGAAGGEKEFFYSLWKDFEELRAEAGAGSGGEAGRGVGELARLFGDGLDDAGIFVPEIDAHELRAEVEVALACAVSEPAALGIGDMKRLPGFLKAPGAVVALARYGGNLLGCEGRGCFDHGWIVAFGGNGE